MFIDTHCHLNFKRFKGRVEEVIQSGKDNKVETIIVPGTDISSSIMAIELSQKQNIYAAVGIHPHHAYEIDPLTIDNRLLTIEKLMQKKNVVAVGEVGIDRHVYKNTKYAEYLVDKSFIETQKKLFKEQMKLAMKYKKSLVIHNREAKRDVTEIMRELWDTTLEHHTVFHCCEPDVKLLQFAQEHHMFLGVDGDITYWKEKQEFIKNVPLEMLVLETDAPFLLPEPLKSQKMYPNEPKNIILIAQAVAQLKGISLNQVEEQTTKNAKKLFNL